MGNVLKANPYNIFMVRRLQFPPNHFEYVDIPFQYNINEALEKWIEGHLKSRYYVGRSTSLDHDKTIVNTVRIGFEESRELSYFMLACPHLKYK